MIRFLFSLFLVFFLSSCMHNRFTCCHTSQFISVFPEVINQKTRASTHVNTPDPLHAINPHGQRLYVSWKLPKEYKNQELKGVLRVRFNEPLQEEFTFEIDKLSGTLIYEITNEDYFNRKGVLSYKAEIYFESQKIDEFKHKMWAELISID